VVALVSAVGLGPILYHYFSFWRSDSSDQCPFGLLTCSPDSDETR